MSKRLKLHISSSIRYFFFIGHYTLILKDRKRREYNFSKKKKKIETVEKKGKQKTKKNEKKANFFTL